MCGECYRAYPVRDDIPILLIDEARVEPQEIPSVTRGSPFRVPQRHNVSVSRLIQPPRSTDIHLGASSQLMAQ